jgi:hypothetical protein
MSVNPGLPLPFEEQEFLVQRKDTEAHQVLADFSLLPGIGWELWSV